MHIITENEFLYLNALRLADDHRKHCEGATCNISLSVILNLLHKAGIEVPQDEVNRFL